MTIEVQVRNNNVEKAIRVLKKKIQKCNPYTKAKGRQIVCLYICLFPNSTKIT